MIEQTVISFSLLLSFVYLVYKSIKNYNLPFSDSLDPIFIYVLFIVVFFWNNAVIFDYSYSFWTVAVIFIGTISYIAGDALSNNSRLEKNSSYKHFILNYKLAFFLSIVVIILSFLLFLLKLSYYNYTFVQYISNMLLFHASNIKSGGYFWVVFSKLLYFLIVYFTYCMVARKPKFTVLFLCWLLLLLYKVANLSHSRWDYIETVIVVLSLWMLLIKRKPTFKIYWLLLIPLIPAFMIILNILRHGRSFVDEFNFYQAIQDSLKGDSGPGIYFDKFVQYFIETDAYNYGIYVFYQLFALVPRVIWTDKPVTSSLIYYTDVIMGEDPFIDGSTYTYTIFDFFGIYHFISLAPLMFLFGWVSRKIYKNIYTSQRISVKVFSILFIANYINTLRGSLLDQLTLIIVDVTTLFIVYLFFERFNRNANPY